MIDRFHWSAVSALVSSSIFIIWLATGVRQPMGILYFLLELHLYVLLLLFVINHWKRRYVLSGGPYSLRAIVDVFIPSKTEPADMLERTLYSASLIDYPNLRLYLLDDGAREWVKELAKKYGYTYLVRPNHLTKPYKAATLNYGLAHSWGNYILVLDADHTVKPTMLDDLLGHFKDPKVALVATRQGFAIDKNDFNHDHLFYEYMQPGKNADGAAMSCGSGVIYRRSALTKIGGFSEWNVVEDLHTSYLLNSHGFQAVYVNQPYTQGVAPQDLKVIYKQRGTWALDSLRLLFWNMPLLNRKLSFLQRLHYLEMGYIYLVGGFVLPLLFFLNFYSLFSNTPLVQAGFWYVLLKIPSHYLTVRLYSELGRGSAESRMWAGLYPVYFLAIFRALIHVKPRYQVTEKGVEAQVRRITLVIPQAFTVALGILAILYHLSRYSFSSLFTVNVFWFSVMVYWLWPVLGKALAISPSLPIKKYGKNYSDR